MRNKKDNNKELLLRPIKLQRDYTGTHVAYTYYTFTFTYKYTHKMH